MELSILANSCLSPDKKNSVLEQQTPYTGNHPGRQRYSLEVRNSGSNADARVTGTKFRGP